MANDKIDDKVAAKVCGTLQLEIIEGPWSGAFKVVYRVRDAEGKQFAIKLMDAARASARSEREAKILRDANHPCVARLVGEGTLVIAEKLTVRYLIEEFFAGGTLGARSNSVRLSVIESLRIGKEIVTALAYLNGAYGRCVHRDIKPENIMFRQPGDRPVLVDFGIARLLDEASITQTFQDQGPCTPMFASPEQLNNEKDLIDWRSDQFSLAVTLSMVTLGMHPYQISADADLPIDIVGRVRSRVGPSELFKSRVHVAGMSLLYRMVAPWSYNRFRFHRDLEVAFN